MIFVHELGHFHRGEGRRRVRAALLDRLRSRDLPQALSLPITGEGGCASTTDLRVLCWGDNTYGESAPTAYLSGWKSPASVSLPDVTDPFAGVLYA